MFMKFIAAFGAALAFASTTPAHAVLISEFSPNPPGAIDPSTQTIELSGIAGMDFTGFVLSIGGEFSRFGTVDSAAAVSGTFDQNGLLAVEITDLINPTHTIVLVNNFTGTVGVTDIDTNNTGTADNTSSLIGIQDAIGVAGSATDVGRLYGDQLGGQDFAFTGDSPRLVFRDASIGNWYALNDPDNNQIFNIDAQDVSSMLTFDQDPFMETFGQINPSAVTAVPEPSSTLALVGLSLVGLRKLRRRAKFAAIAMAN